jgi:hypothetical protein
MSFKLFGRWLRGRSSGGAARRARRPDKPKSRLGLELLERRELLSDGMAPRIVSMQPANGTVITNPNPTVSVTYSENVNTNEAQNQSNYELFNSSGNAIPITSASYDSVHFVATLTYTTPPGGLPSDSYSLFVRGDQIHDTDEGLPLSQPNQLVLANPGTQNVSTINVPGDGTLQAIANFADTGNPASPTAAPAAVALADVTNDGLPDLILLSSQTHVVEIYRGTSIGNFENTAFEVLSVPVGPNAQAPSPQAMVVADLNGDNLPDIAVADTADSQVSVFLNTGGAFGLAAQYSVDRNPVGIVAADFNGDGHVDLATVANVQDLMENSYNVTVLLQDPSNAGHFLTTQHTFDTGLTTPTGLATADLNQDGKSDLVISSGTGVRILFNATPNGGSVAFLQSSALTTISTAGIAVGRIDGDTLPDLVAISRTTNQALVFQSLSGGFFASPIALTLNATPRSVAIGDVNGDTKNDILVTSGQGAQSAVEVLTNQTTPGNIAFTAPVFYTVDNAPVAIAVHVNGSGRVDVTATANSQGNDATVLRTGANGRLLVSRDISLGSSAPNAVAVGDLNNDHIPDIVIANLPSGGFGFTDSVSILLSQGNGTYAAPITINVGNDFFGSPQPLSLVLADLTGTGIPDILVSNPSDQTITIVANGGTGSFSALSPIPVGGTPTGIAVADFNGDGTPDIAVAHQASGTTPAGVTILLGQGNRAFAQFSDVAAAFAPIGILSADFNRDGTPDLAVLSSGAAGQVQIIRTANSPALSFSALAAIPAGSNPTAFTVGDLNRDNFLDIVIATHTTAVNGLMTDSISVLLNNGVGGAANGFGAVIKTDVLQNATQPIQGLVVTDLNRDLFPDVAAVSDGSVNNVIASFGHGDGLFNDFTNDIVNSSAGGGAELAGSSFTGSTIATVGTTLIRAGTFTVSRSVVSSNLVINGGFDSTDLSAESGNLVGWQTNQLPGSHGSWAAQTGTVSPYGEAQVPLPSQGQYTAMLDAPDIGNDLANSETFGAYPATQPSDYNGTHVLYQDIQIPDGATQVTLSFALFLRSQAAFTDTAVVPTLDYTISQPNQQVRVDIVNPLAGLYDVGAGVLENVFRTDPTMMKDSGGYQTFTADLTAFHGRTIRLRIAEANNQGRLIVGLDNVQVQALFTESTAPGLSNIHLRNPGYGATPTFGGNSTDPTIVGNVTDLGSPNNIAFIQIDPTNGNFTGPDVYVLMRATGGIDDFGHFSTTLPSLLSDGREVLPGPITVGIRAVNRAGLAATTTFTFNLQGPSLTAWQAMGPNQINFTGQGVNFSPHGQSFVSGRVTSVLTDPHDSTGNTYYIGSDNGGVWRTTDGGANWTPLTDFVADATGAPIPVSVSSLALDPRIGTQTIYAATGVADNEPTSNPGIGILRSLDGGLTWTVQGRSVFGGARISKIAVNSQGWIYAAVASGGSGAGVYRSEDQGQTWTQLLTPSVMFLDAGGTVAAGTPLASVTDIEIDPTNEERIWIGLGNIGLLAASSTGGVWLSTSGTDSSVTWQQIVGGHNQQNVFFVIRNQTIPSGTGVGKVVIGLPQTPTPNESIAYIMMATASAGTNWQDDGTSMSIHLTGNGANPNISIGVYKTKDGGLSFTPVMLRENSPLPMQFIHFVNLFTLGHEAGNIGTLIVDPTNPNVFYLGGSTRFGQASDNGTNFAVPRHGFIRVDTTNMRDTTYVSPFIMPPPGKIGVMPNDGDDIIKATDAILFSNATQEPGSYPTGTNGGGYQGEGVFWYDLSSTDFGAALSTFAGFFNQRELVPESIDALAFDSRGRLLVGTEMGVWRGVSQGFIYDTTNQGIGMENFLGHATPTELGMTFTDLNSNLEISDTTSVAIDPYNRNVIHSTQANTGWARTDGGTQFVSTNDAAFGPGLLDGAADTGPVRTGPRNPNAPAGTLSNVYRTMQYVVSFATPDDAQVQISTDGGHTFTQAIAGLNLADIRNSTFFPLATNPTIQHDASGLPQDELLYWTNRILESDNSASFWDPVSAILPTGGDRVTALAFGPSGQDVFYVGTAGGQIFVDLHGGGDGFPSRSISSIAGRAVNGITVDPTNAMIAYAMIGGTGGRHVFRTTNAGQSWTDITGSGAGALPDVPAYAMAIDPRATPDAPNGKLFVGTGVGVYVSVNFTSGSPTWQRLGVVNSGGTQVFTLPNIPVRDLQFSQNYERLVAATQGRGVFEISTDRAGAHVASFSPVSPSSPGLRSITVTFNKPVDPRTFTTAAVQSLRGPGGPIPVDSVVDLDPTNHLTYEILFQPQTQDGTYTLVLSQTITDFVGFQLDQNQNGISGEPTDTFTAQFAVNTTDNGRFITGAYNDILHRQTDTGAFLTLLPILDANRFVELGQIATTFVTSAEARSRLIIGYFQTFLQRVPQTSELSAFLGAMAQGTTPEQIITMIINSPEYFTKRGATDLGFINQAYQDVLGRPADPTGIGGFLNLAETTPHATLANQLDHSIEYDSHLISSYYTRLLPGHTPTSSEISAWVFALQHTLTDEEVAAQFIGSPEYFVLNGGDNSNWLNAAYMDILGRPVDAASRPAYLAELQAGVPRSTVALQILSSTEYERDLLTTHTHTTPYGDSLYQHFLHRDPTSAEITAGLTSFAQGATDEAIISSLVASPEHFQLFGIGTTQVTKDQAWLHTVYMQILGRDIDSGAASAWLSFLTFNEQNGRTALSQLLPQSDEYRANLITQTYISLLHRRPGAVEVANWLPLLRQGSAPAGQPSPHEQFIIDVVQSGEYFFLQRGTDLIASSKQWLVSMFTNILGRATVNPSAPDFQAYLNTLLAAYQPERMAVADQLDTSFEYRLGLVQNFYQTYLRRKATPVEIAAFTNANPALTDEQLIAMLVSSNEYFLNVNLGNSSNSAWVNQVYKDLLGRDADALAQGWVDYLNTHPGVAGRLTVATAILSSTEYRNRLVNQLFSTYLHRNATGAEMSAYGQLLAQGSTDEHLISLLVASNEYFLLTHPYP